MTTENTEIDKELDDTTLENNANGEQLIVEELTPEEQLTNEQLIAEKYRGIRPAPGYPACPDHLDKSTLFDLLDARAIGMSLTESLAMHPASSVSGYYFAHPDSKYFAVGKLAKDQIESYAALRGIDVATVEKWLAPNLNY